MLWNRVRINVCFFQCEGEWFSIFGAFCFVVTTSQCCWSDSALSAWRVQQNHHGAWLRCKTLLIFNTFQKKKSILDRIPDLAAIYRTVFLVYCSLALWLFLTKASTASQEPSEHTWSARPLYFCAITKYKFFHLSQPSEDQMFLKGFDSHLPEGYSAKKIKFSDLIAESDCRFPVK